MSYDKIKYPDGQISVKIHNYGLSRVAERINSYEDLFFIKSIAQFMKDFHTGVDLYIPCLFGQRSDRKFDEKQSFDLKIIADFINSCGFNQVKIFDPHSDVSLALIDNSVKITSFSYVSNSVGLIRNANPNAELVLVSPDAGAYKKVFEYGDKLNLPVVAANKFRDKQGEITLHFLGDVKGKECLIVDDLCDGGYTFIKLGEALKAQGASKVFLYVSHGYFSKGFEPLMPVVDHIYCTNSVKDVVPANAEEQAYITQFKVI